MFATSAMLSETCSQLELRFGFIECGFLHMHIAGDPWVPDTLVNAEARLCVSGISTAPPFHLIEHVFDRQPMSLI